MPFKVHVTFKENITVSGGRSAKKGDTFYRGEEVFKLAKEAAAASAKLADRTLAEKEPLYYGLNFGICHSDGGVIHPDANLIGLDEAEAAAELAEAAALAELEKSTKPADKPADK